MKIGDTIISGHANDSKSAISNSTSVEPVMVMGSIEKTTGSYTVDVFAKGSARLDFPTLIIEVIKYWIYLFIKTF